MPGRRCYQRERVTHMHTAPQRQRALYDMLCTHLPHLERALVGRIAILDFFHSLGLRRPNGGHLSWRMVDRWRRTASCPILAGSCRPIHPRWLSPPMSTSFALTSWLLTRFNTGEPHLFRVYQNPLPAAEGSRAARAMPERSRSAPGVGKGRWKRPLAMIELGETRAPSHGA